VTDGLENAKRGWLRVGDLWKARDEAAFTAEERDELTGKTKNKTKK
jgi:hypothetical protein